jgi:glutamine amidotransferase
LQSSERPSAAIVDYGVGNLFSVMHGLRQVGIPATITSSKDDILAASMVVVPGVGAFGDAMASLHRLDLVEPLREVAASEQLLVGICLGMQLLMTESHEFGTHRGLDIFPGVVVPFTPSLEDDSRLKVPHVGWTRNYTSGGRPDGWTDSPLEGLSAGEYLYFVHSYYAVPEDSGLATSVATYGDTEFCSSLWRGGVFGCQFHPERSGTQGLRIYRNLASMIAPLEATERGGS